MKLPFSRPKGWLVIAWLLMVAGVSIYLTLPNRSLPEAGHFDQICRFLAFAVLAFLPFQAFPRLRNSVYLSLLVAVLGLVLEEFRKSIPGRHYSVMNMLVNNGGVVVGFAIGILVRYIRLGGKHNPVDSARKE